MPPIELPGVCKIATTGKTVIVTSGTATSWTAVPVDSNGAPAKVLRISVDHFCHIKFGGNSSATSAVVNDTMLNPNSGPDYFNVQGEGWYSLCLDTAQNTTAVVNLVAVEL